MNILETVLRDGMCLCLPDKDHRKYDWPVRRKKCDVFYTLFPLVVLFLYFGFYKDWTTEAYILVILKSAGTILFFFTFVQS